MVEISTELLKVLVCPLTKKQLSYDKQAQELISEEAGLAFPIKDGIPYLLVEKARRIPKKQSLDVTKDKKILSEEESEEEFA